MHPVWHGLCNSSHGREFLPISSCWCIQEGRTRLLACLLELEKSTVHHDYKREQEQERQSMKLTSNPSSLSFFSVTLPTEVVSHSSLGIDVPLLIAPWYWTHGAGLWWTRSSCTGASGRTTRERRRSCDQMKENVFWRYCDQFYNTCVNDNPLV